MIAHGTTTDHRVLRLFAGSWAMMCVLASWLVDGWAPVSLAGLLLLALAILFGAGLVFPRLMARPYRLVEQLLTPVGRLFSLIVLFLVYFGVFTPFAAVLRLLGWDPLRLRSRHWGVTAWHERSHAAQQDDYRWQY